MLCAFALLAACASTPAPHLDVMAKAETPAIEMKGPVQLPERARAVPLQVDGVDYFALDAQGAQRLVARDLVCEANTQIAAHCAAGFKDLSVSYGLLLQQAQLLEAQHNYMAERWAQAEDQIRQRDRERLIETWLTRILLLGAALAAAE